MLEIAGSSPTRFNQEIFPQAMQMDMPDIECRIMSSVSPIPTPHSAVGRSEQWLDLCSRPSDEDVKGETNPQNNWGSIRAEKYVESKNQYHFPQKTTIFQILPKVWSPMAVAIFDKNVLKVPLCKPKVTFSMHLVNCIKRSSQGKLLKFVSWISLFISLVHDYKCWFFNNFLKINILLSINCDFFIA